MNPSTGEIKDWSEVLKMPDAEQKKFVSIPDEEAGVMMQMNRKQRREYYRKNHKKWEANGGGSR